MISYKLFLDQWSMTFVALILGIGLLVGIFALGYLHDNSARKKFFPTFILFALSMLGVVTFDHLIMLFIAWELTSILSFFLISFDPEDPKARRGALHAALITGAGGLCMLFAILLLQNITGTFSLQENLQLVDKIQAHPWAQLIAVMFFIAGATKSALFPFSFWLPGAMTAPTPVSSYLHSATMVKAGIFLFYRLSPLFLAVPLWGNLLVGFGLLTFVWAAIRSFSEDDLKGILAYTTVASLGLMSFLIGTQKESAMVAVVAFLIAHALYKCGLFQFAGIIDHQAHTRKLSELGNLSASAPKLKWLGRALAFVGMGIIPSYAFLAKEKILMSVDQSFWMLILLFVGFSFMGAAILRVCLAPFAQSQKAMKVEEPGFLITLSPWILFVISLLLVFVSGKTKDLWHGINLELILSLLSVGVAVLFYLFAQKVIRYLPFSRLEGARYFESGLKWHFQKTLSLTRLLQSGSLRQYLIVIFVAAAALMLWHWPQQNVMHWHWKGATSQGLIVALAAVKLFAMWWMIKSESPITSVISLGLIGYVVAIFFALFGAPDLAMTQFAVETLSVFLFVFVLKDVSRFKERSSPAHFAFDVVLSVFAGVLMFAVTWMAIQTQGESRLRDFFAQTSLLEANGRNVVNVILVDYRGFDTMGEISVLGIAAIGVIALLKIQKGVKK
ncbi:MAG: hydrogen gas-evolving membrane-bound hydrogenase subunit E [Bdellovibrionia bacterium]